MRSQALAWIERGAQHPARQRLDQPGLLGDGNELVGRHQAAQRVLPAHQRFDPDSSPVCRSNFGW